MIRIAPLLRNSFVPNRRNRVRDYRLTRLRGNAINRCQFLRRLINRRNKKRKRIQPGRNCVIYILYLFLSIIRKILFLILILVNMSHVCLFHHQKWHMFFLWQKKKFARAEISLYYSCSKNWNCYIQIWWGNSIHLRQWRHVSLLNRLIVKFQTDAMR